MASPIYDVAHGPGNPRPYRPLAHDVSTLYGDPEQSWMRYTPGDFPAPVIPPSSDSIEVFCLCGRAVLRVYQRLWFAGEADLTCNAKCASLFGARGVVFAEHPKRLDRRQVRRERTGA